VGPCGVVECIRLKSRDWIFDCCDTSILAYFYFLFHHLTTHHLTTHHLTTVADHEGHE